MRVWLSFILLLCAAACAEADPGLATDEGDMVIERPSRSSALLPKVHDKLLEDGHFETIADAFNAAWKLPRDLTVKHELCGESNAFYRHRDSTIRMCFELLEEIEEAFASQVEAGTIDEDRSEGFVVGTWLFIFLHELGHAVIDLYDLPVLGMEEDAADKFASLVLIEDGATKLALDAAVFWGITDTEKHTELQYNDSHGLNPQRLATIACLSYGSDPDTFEALAPYFKTRDCKYEHTANKRDWHRLLEDWRQ